MPNEEVRALRERIATLEGELEDSRKTQQLLRDKVSYFRNVFMTIPDGVVVTNAERVVVMVNPSIERIFGYSPHEILGRTTEQVYLSSEEFRGMGRRKFAPSVPPDLKPFHISYRKKNGEIFASETVAAPIFEEDGEHLGFVGVVRDVSERAEFLQLTTDVREQLELRVREGTEELRLLTNTLSHDLKNPIIAIKGFANLLGKRLGDSGDEKALEFVGRIIDAVEWGSELLDDLKGLCKARNSILHRTEIDLKQLVEKVVKLVRGSYDGLNVEVEIGADMPDVCADEHLLRRVFENLLRNSVKFMPHHKAPIIRIEASAAEGEIVVRVEDNGDGIPPAEVRRVFSPFVRLNDEVEGIGLGLDIAKRFVELHGGKIWATPNDQIEGACINFTLPLTPVGQADKQG
jgi:PAS domain S-box-containing protein